MLLDVPKLLLPCIKNPIESATPMIAMPCVRLKLFLIQVFCPSETYFFHYAKRQMITVVISTKGFSAEISCLGRMALLDTELLQIMLVVTAPSQLIAKEN